MSHGGCFHLVSTWFLCLTSLFVSKWEYCFQMHIKSNWILYQNVVIADFLPASGIHDFTFSIRLLCFNILSMSLVVTMTLLETAVRDAMTVARDQQQIELCFWLLVCDCHGTETSEEVSMKVTLVVLPWPWKICKPELRMQNAPNGNTTFSQKVPYIAEKFYTHMRRLFWQFAFGTYRKTAVAFSHLQVMWLYFRVKRGCEIEINLQS